MVARALAETALVLPGVLRVVTRLSLALAGLPLTLTGLALTLTGLALTLTGLALTGLAL